MSASSKAVSILNANGTAPILLICDHASAHIPEEFGSLGLPNDLRLSHAGWDPGAATLARLMALILDAPLIGTAVSRLVIDTNRALDAPDLIPVTADGVAVPGNTGLSEAQRAERIAAFHEPYHRAIAGFLESRPSVKAVASIHSFEPVLDGASRPWHVGVVHDDDADLATRVRMELSHEGRFIVGDNEPYSPGDGVFYSLTRHAAPRGRARVMLEVRNDLLRDDSGIEAWATRLASALKAAVLSLRRSGAASR